MDRGDPHVSQSILSAVAKPGWNLADSLGAEASRQMNGGLHGEPSRRRRRRVSSSGVSGKFCTCNLREKAPSATTSR